MDALTTLAKFVHIATISIWASGLVCLPFLFAQRKDAGRPQALYRLHGMVRFLYVALLSPTAFVAVGSGIALIFLRETFEPWFAVKLALVGVMVVLHVFSGLTILWLFDEDSKYSRFRYVVFTGGTLVTVLAIFVVVSGKPDFDMRALTPEWVAPGRLSELVSAFAGAPL